MRQVPFLLKDLVEAAHKLPDPATFKAQEVSIPVKDSLQKDRPPRDLLFRKWSYVSPKGTDNYWVVWHTIAIK
jgi:hypothetical protein